MRGDGAGGVSSDTKTRGVVYTETVVHSPPPDLAAEAPYQLVIVEFEGGKRHTGRMLEGRVSIGDAVEVAEERDGVLLFRKVG